VVGNFAGTANFDPGAGTAILSGPWGQGFIQKLDLDGNLIWARQLTGEVGKPRAFPVSVDLDPAGNIYLGGRFEYTIDMDPNPAPAAVHNLTSIGRFDGFIEKLTPDGDLLWVNHIGSADQILYEDLNKIKVSPSGNYIYAIGSFGPGDVYFNLPNSSNNLQSQGNLDVFVQKLDTDNGDVVWIKQAGSAESVYAYDIDLDPDVNVLVCGTFNSETNFNLPLGNYTITPNVSNDGFLMKLESINTYPAGVTPIVWTVTDASGNTATCTQTVNITDTESPIMSCYTDTTVYLDASGLYTLQRFEVDSASSDNCDITNWSLDTSNFTCANTGALLTVTFTGTDDAGNNAQCQTLVTVLDTITPTIICPANVPVSTDAGICSASGVNLGTPVIADNCSNPIASNDAIEPFALGSNDVIWTVDDGNGQTATCVQVVTVTDNEPPIALCKPFSVLLPLLIFFVCADFVQICKILLVV